MLLVVAAAVWLLGIPLVVCAVTVVCAWVDERRARSDGRSLGVLLAFDPDRVPHERRHGRSW